MITLVPFTISERKSLRRKARPTSRNVPADRVFPALKKRVGTTFQLGDGEGHGNSHKVASACFPAQKAGRMLPGAVILPGSEAIFAISPQQRHPAHARSSKPQ